jgi:uncharacterized protein YndB with AHSA1/START domain
MTMQAAIDPARPLADDELLITRRFAAPPALVWRLWSDPAHMIRWWGPKDFTCTHLDFQPEPARPWRACIVSRAYGESWMSGVFRDVEPGRRLVMTFAWEDGRDQPGVETEIVIEWHADGDGTIQHFHQWPFVKVESRDSHVGGWTQCIDREQAYVMALLEEPNP